MPSWCQRWSRDQRTARRADVCDLDSPCGGRGHGLCWLQEAADSVHESRQSVAVDQVSPTEAVDDLAFGNTCLGIAAVVSQLEVADPPAIMDGALGLAQIHRLRF